MTGGVPALEWIAQSMCNQFGAMVHNQSTDWDSESDGTKDWWRSQAKMFLEDFTTVGEIAYMQNQDRYVLLCDDGYVRPFEAFTVLVLDPKERL